MFDQTVFATMCRLCLNENSELINVDSKDQCNTKKSTKKVTQITREIVERFTTIMIQPGDSLPQKICRSCFEALRAMLVFQKKCKQSNEELLNRIKDLGNQDNFKGEVDIKVEIKSEDEISEGFGVDDIDLIDNISGTIEEEDEEDECETKEILNVNVDDMNSSLKSESLLTEENSEDRNQKSQTKHSVGMRACHICGKLIRNYRLPYHMNIHDGLKPFACDIDKCTSTFAAPYQLQVHKRLVHIKTADLSCDVCGRAFKRKQALNIHLSYHFDPKIPCKVCEKLFRNGRALDKHMLVHTMERKFKCDTCEKSFQTRYTLRVHKRVHTQEKPYSCHCGVSFAYNCLLKAHTEKYHK